MDTQNIPHGATGTAIDQNTRAPTYAALRDARALKARADYLTRAPLPSSAARDQAARALVRDYTHFLAEHAPSIPARLVAPVSNGPTKCSGCSSHPSRQCAACGSVAAHVLPVKDSTDHTHALTLCLTCYGVLLELIAVCERKGVA